MISIIDYGAGNLRSVQNTLAELGASYKLIDTPDAVRAADKLVLPGVVLGLWALLRRRPA